MKDAGYAVFVVFLIVAVPAVMTNVTAWLARLAW